MFSKKEDKSEKSATAKLVVKADLEKMIQSASGKEPKETLVIDFVDSLMVYADKARASDIHFEPKPNGKAITRLRIDGMLRDEFELPIQLHSQCIARLKIMTDMRSDEHRAPQDGRFSFQTEKEIVDVRASLIATVYGEKAVLRLLSGTTHGLSLSE
ncbi:MAG TPA: hypothetical protein DEG92_03550, partial [Rikenellaceae bacterium]|nr:hypothetical protein [Rikenellaceae bacterium]